MRALFVLLFMASSVMTVAAPENTKEEWDVWSFKRAVDQALTSNSGILKQKQIIKEQEAKKLGTWASLLPKVDYNYTWSRRKDTLSLGFPQFEGASYNLYFSEFTIEQPVIYGGALWSEPIVDREALKQANLNMQILNDKTLVEVAKRYSQILVHKEQVNTYTRQLKVQENLVRQADKMFRAGTERKLTVYRFKAQSATLKPRLIEAQKNLENEAIALMNFLNTRTASKMKFSGDLKKLAEQKIEVKEGVYKDVLEEQVIRSRLRAFEASKSVAMAEHYPQVSITGSWGTRSNTRADLFSDLSRQWAYGVNIKIPLFSGLSSLTQRRQLAAQQARLTIDKKQLDKDVLQNQIQTRKNFVSAKESLEATKNAFELTKSAYQEASKRLRLGTLKYTEFFDVEKEYIESELNYHNALREYFLSLVYYYDAYDMNLRSLIL